MKKFTKGIVLATVAAAAAVAVLLVVDRFVLKDAGSRRQQEGPVRHVQLREHRPNSVREIIPDENFLRNQTEGMVKKRYAVRIDEKGFIMPSKRHDAPDRSIFFLGGSTTECLFNDEDVRFPALAGTLLEKRTGLRIDSYNSGVAGNNTLHAINILVNKVLPLAPDAAVLMENVNDLTILLLERSYWNSNPNRAPVITAQERIFSREALGKEMERLLPNLTAVVSRLFPPSYRLRPVHDEFTRLRGRKVSYDPAVLTGEYAANLSMFVAICRSRGITPVLMTQANRFTPLPDPFIAGLMAHFEKDYGISYAEFSRLYALFNDTVRNVGRRERVLVIDLDRAVPKDKTHLYDTVHLTNDGSRSAAEAISAALAPVLEKAAHRASAGSGPAR